MLWRGVAAERPGGICDSREVGRKYLRVRFKLRITEMQLVWTHLRNMLLLIFPDRQPNLVQDMWDARGGGEEALEKYQKNDDSGGADAERGP